MLIECRWRVSIDTLPRMPLVHVIHIDSKIINIKFSELLFEETFGNDVGIEHDC